MPALLPMSALPLSPSDPDVAMLLEAWNSATERLRRTHETLRDEVRRLTDELERKNRELARKNRLADLGQMASHVAHEVRNSLVPMTLYLSLLRRKAVEDAETRSILDKFAAGVTALESTVTDLLHFTADREPDVSSFNLAALANEIRASLAPQLRAQEIEVTIDVPPELSGTADRRMLERALLNLTLNALDVMPGGGRLRLFGRRGEGRLELGVADSGGGIDSAALPHLFEPFYSSKSGGTGLGLTIVERIAAAHGGTAAATNRDGGAVFTISIPQSQEKTP